MEQKVFITAKPNIFTWFFKKMYLKKVFSITGEAL